MTLPGDVIDAGKHAELRNEWRLVHYGEPPSFIAQGWSEMHLGESNGGGLDRADRNGGERRP